MRKSFLGAIVALLTCWSAVAFAGPVPSALGFFDPANINQFTTASVKAKGAYGTITGAYPYDRIPYAPALPPNGTGAFASPQDTTDNYYNGVFGTTNYPAGTYFVTQYPTTLTPPNVVSDFSFMSYGNYLDGTPGLIPAVHIKDIQTLTETYNFTYNSSPPGNGNIDFFLFSSPAGSTATKLYEIQVYWNCAPAGKSGFLDTLPVVGNYTSPAINSTPQQIWKVTYDASSGEGNPGGNGWSYYQLMLTDGSGNIGTMNAGTIDIGAMLAWLQTQYKPVQYNNAANTPALLGTEYYTGHASGYENLGGTTTLLVNALSRTFTPSAAVGGTTANELIYPAALTDQAWTPNHVTAANTGVILEDATTNYHTLQQGITQNPQTAHHYKLSARIYGPASGTGLTRNYVNLNLYSSNGGGATGFFGFSQGYATNSYGYSGVSLYSASTMTAVSGQTGVYDVAMYIAMDSAYSVSFVITPSTDGSTTNYLGSASDGIKVTGITLQQVS